MNINKSLAILALSINTKNFYKEFLTSIFENNIDISFYSVEENVTGPIHSDVVLTTHSILIDKARVIFPDSIIIDSKKILVGNNLEELMMQPKGKKVLVVSNHNLVTNETINDLKILGINHLEYVMYDKKSNLKLNEFDIAISPGMIHLCPPEIKNKIDIGGRILSIETFMNLLQAMDLEINYLNHYVNIFLRQLIKSSRKLAELVVSSQKLTTEMETVLNLINEGIIAVENNIIKSINPAAMSLLGLESNTLQGQNISVLFKDFKTEYIPNINKEGEENSLDVLLTNKEKRIICSKKVIPSSNNNSKEEFLYTIKEVEIGRASCRERV